MSLLLTKHRRGKRIAIRFESKDKGKTPSPFTRLSATNSSPYADSHELELVQLTRANGHLNEDVKLPKDYFLCKNDTDTVADNCIYFHRDGYPKLIKFTSVPSGEQVKCFNGEALVLEEEVI